GGNSDILSIRARSVTRVHSVVGCKSVSPTSNFSWRISYTAASGVPSPHQSTWSAGEKAVTIGCKVDRARRRDRSSIVIGYGDIARCGSLNRDLIITGQTGAARKERRNLNSETVYTQVTTRIWVALVQDSKPPATRRIS